MGIVTACGNLSVEDKKEKLSEYMQAVYAPKTMGQFYSAKEDSLSWFNDSVTNRLFVAYTDELSELDKLRSCETIITHGKADNQSDGKERFLVRAFLYESPKSDAVIKYFTFILNDDGNVEDFSIEDEI